VLYDLPTGPPIRLVGPDDTALWATLGAAPGGRHALVIGEASAPGGATVIAGSLPDLAAYLDPLAQLLTQLRIQEASQAACGTLRHEPAPGSQLPPVSEPSCAGGHQAAVPLTHTPYLTVPHDRLRVTSLAHMPTHDGIAFTAELAMDGQYVGTIENHGIGGSTHYRALNSSPFNGRHLAAFAAGSRRRGAPVSTEDVLLALIMEFEEAQVLATATGAGRSPLRLMAPAGDGEHLANVYYAAHHTTAGNLTTARQRAGLVAALASTPVDDGRWWQLWTGERWEDLTPPPPPDRAGP